MEIIDYKEQYKEYLKDPRWKALAQRIRYRDNDRCKICGCKKTRGMEMNVHHLRYYPNHKPWEYDESDLITLCRDCHKKLHINNDFAKMGRGGYFYHKYHKGVGIVTNKYSDRIWYGLCWTETERYEGDNHGRLYVESEAYIEDIRPATKAEIADFWNKVEKYYSKDEISELFDGHIKGIIPSFTPANRKVQDTFKRMNALYNKYSSYVKEKYNYYLLISDDNYAEFDDKRWVGHTDWTVAAFPSAYFHVADIKDIKEKPQQDNIKNVAFENFDFTGYRAATTEELREWLDYLYNLDCLYENE